jgi:hypothetical protein
MSFLDTAKKLAEAVGTALGGPMVPAVIEIGNDLLKLFDSAKEIVGEDDAEKLQVIIDDLEPKVMAHADSTEKTLRGEA